MRESLNRRRVTRECNRFGAAQSDRPRYRSEAEQSDLVDHLQLVG